MVVIMWYIPLVVKIPICQRLYKFQSIYPVNPSYNYIIHYSGLSRYPTNNRLVFTAHVSFIWEPNLAQIESGHFTGPMCFLFHIGSMYGTRWKIDMEPKHHPIEKENHLPNHHFQAHCSESLVHSSRYSSRELPTKILMVLLVNTHTWVFNVLFFVFLFLRFKETLYAAALEMAASKATWPVESTPTGTTGGLSDGFAGIRMKLFGGLKVQVMKKIRTSNNIATNQ